MPMSGFVMPSEAFMVAQLEEARAKGREEGRREVLREIAKMPEPLELGAVPMVFVPGWRHVDRCEWCHVECPVNTQMTHAPTCLWLRAAQAVKDAE